MFTFLDRSQLVSRFLSPSNIVLSKLSDSFIVSFKSKSFGGGVSPDMHIACLFACLIIRSSTGLVPMNSISEPDDDERSSFSCMLIEHLFLRLLVLLFALASSSTHDEEEEEREEDEDDDDKYISSGPLYSLPPTVTEILFMLCCC